MNVDCKGSDTRVSIVIVTWNSQAVISECLNSLLMYIEDNDEIIVVDNASSDSTRQMVSSVDSKQVRLIALDENLGFGCGNNVGVQQAKGHFVALINPDIVFDSDSITPGIEYLEKHAETGIVSPKLINLDGTFQQTCSFFPTPNKEFFSRIGLVKLLPKKVRQNHFPNQVQLEGVCPVDWTISAYQIMRTEDYRAIGGFSDDYFMYCEDMDLCKKMSLILDRNTVYMGMVSAVHIGGYSESVDGAPNKAKRCVEGISIFESKYSADKRIAVLSAIRLAGCFRIALFKMARLVKPLPALRGKIIDEQATIKTCDEIISQRGV